MNAAKQGAIRIGSNYARLFTTFMLGLVLVRLLLRFGNDAYALVALLGAGTGLASLLQEVVRASMIPELGAAYHSGEPDRFRSTYNTAILMCVVAATVTLGAFGLLGLLLPLLNIPDGLVHAGLWFVGAKAVQVFFVIALAPTFNMYVVSERMVAFNAWSVVERAAEVTAAILVVLAVGVVDEGTAIITYGIASATLGVGSLLTASIVLAIQDARLRPAIRSVSRRAARSLLRSVGWNSVVVLSMNLYTRLDMFIMNAVFGLFGNLVFGIASQLTFYVRQLTMGLVTGIDAVSARLASTADMAAVRRLVAQSTRLQAIVVFPAAVGVVVFAEPLIQFWVGARLSDPQESLPAVVMLVRILVLGIAARSLSEGWMRILAGAGQVQRYAHVVLLGALANPVLATVALLLFPESLRYTAPACVFTVLLSLVHLGLLPRIVSRQLGAPYREIIAPLARPLIAVVLCLPIALPALYVTVWTLPTFVVFAVTFSAFYLLAATWIVVDTNQRRRAATLVWNQLSRLKTT